VTLRPAFLPSSLNLFLPPALEYLLQPTSVGLRYGLAKFSSAKGGDSDSFLGRRNLQIAFGLPRRLLEKLAVVLPDFPSKTGLFFQREQLYRPAWIIPLRPAPDSNLAKCRNINLLVIPYAFRPQVRHRLTPRRRTLRGNPWASGRPDSHRALRYSFRHSHFPALQPALQRTFTALGTLPYQPLLRSGNPKSKIPNSK
jgi:hypothetical protein